jgi:DNA-directed RNA polymerase subunit M/transcription elongation factor TFIIS
MINKYKQQELKMKRLNRETWLNLMAKALKTMVFKPAGINLDLRKVKISVGYPPKGGARKGYKTIGVCFARRASDANVNEIFINPCLDKKNVGKVGGVLVHELIHAVDDCKNGHGPVFRKMALACGLTGRMTATTETPELVETIKKIEKKIGKYPHKKLNYEIGRKKQSTRQIKVECPSCANKAVRYSNNNLRYIVRMSRTTFEKGTPFCGVCRSDMVEA